MKKNLIFESRITFLNYCQGLLRKLRLFMNIHSLPFSIGFNGEAEVDSAFPIKIDNQSSSVESSFRGRKLVGRIHKLPSNLSGEDIFIKIL